MDGARHPNSHTMHPNRVLISFFCCTGIFLTGIFFSVQFAGERRITAYKFRDWKAQRASINTSLLPGAANRTVECRFIHIPKCAGISFIKDAAKILGKENLILLGPYEGEGPYCNSSLGIGDVVLLRNPRHHVLSQFLHCKVRSAELNYTDNGTGDHLTAVACQSQVAATAKAFASWCPGGDRIVSWGNHGFEGLISAFRISLVCRWFKARTATRSDLMESKARHLPPFWQMDR